MNKEIKKARKITKRFLIELSEIKVEALKEEDLKRFIKIIEFCKTNLEKRLVILAMIAKTREWASCGDEDDNK